MVKTVILAGGSGTRLWPLSREFLPKQFIKLFDDKSLFQKTVERALLLSKPENIYVVTNKKHKFLVIDQLREMNIEVPPDNILIEPKAKSTLPAIYYASKEIADKFIVLPSDHLVETNENYTTATQNAIKLADKYLVTFGVFLMFWVKTVEELFIHCHLMAKMW
jgi:mannose-1-phosphate guanylyltransferase/mannose-6-phosphate isomerase